MAFTDRFITLPIKVYDRKQAELTGHEDYEDSFIKINPFEISQYKPSTDGDEWGECVHLVMKGGDDFNVYLTIEEFETALNKIN